MKRLTAILICLCLTVQSVAQVALLGLFELNKDYIAKNLCENLDKPQMSCCGKCYLGKQLDKAGEDEKPSGNTPAKTVKSEVLPCLIPALAQLPAIAFEACSRPAQNPVVRQLHAQLFTHAIFHPPAA